MHFFIRVQWEWFKCKETGTTSIERRKTMCEFFLKLQKNIFVSIFFTGDKRWIHRDNPKHKAAWVNTSESRLSTFIKKHIGGSKVVLCIFRDIKYVVYYKKLKPLETLMNVMYHN